MTLPPFDLHRARSVEEAGELLARYGEDAAVICGGTELLLLLKLGFAVYGHLVDIKGIAELGGIRAENGALVIGATATVVAWPWGVACHNCQASAARVPSVTTASICCVVKRASSQRWR